MTQEPRPTPELLPCPFCGGEPYISEDENRRSRWVSCVACESDGSPVEYNIAKTMTNDELRDAVIAAWNRRTAHTLTPEQVERARKLIADGDENMYEVGFARIGRLAIDLLREVVGDE